ncbi:hypothetical protein CLOP_g9731 [Closterium sp. NIES-67]|nr:hypothetical protein CLOP_g9731 [Closterium sp. NIES-67]
MKFMQRGKPKESPATSAGPGATTGASGSAAFRGNVQTHAAAAAANKAAEEERWFAPAAAAAAAVSRGRTGTGGGQRVTCRVVVEGQPDPGRRMGRMSFGNFNKDVENMEEEGQGAAGNEAHERSQSAAAAAAVARAMDTGGARPAKSKPLKLLTGGSEIGGGGSGNKRPRAAAAAAAAAGFDGSGGNVGSGGVSISAGSGGGGDATGFSTPPVVLSSVAAKEEKSHVKEGWRKRKPTGNS